MRIKMMLSITTVACLSLTGCATYQGQQDGLLGGVAGAVIGGALGGGRGAVAGAAIGAVGGGVYGDQQARRDGYAPPPPPPAYGAPGYYAPPAPHPCYQVDRVPVYRDGYVAGYRNVCRRY